MHTMNESAAILVVEDDAQIGAAIRARLTRLGHAVDLETDGAMANSLLSVERFDLVRKHVRGTQLPRRMARRR